METEETLVFPASSSVGSTNCIRIPLIDNEAFEKMEYFYVHVKYSEQNVVFHQSHVQVHIYDDDSKLIKKEHRDICRTL